VVHWASSRVLWTALYSVHAPKELKKSTRFSNFTPPPTYNLKAACLKFGMWGRVLDVIDRAKFQLNQFRGFRPPGGRNSLSAIDWEIALMTWSCLT